MKRSDLELKNLIRTLEEKKGRHTELVSVYIPSDYKLVSIINQLQQEMATAENIKSKSTRKAVLSALDTIINHLRTYKKLPDNGLAVFCGNVSEREGEMDLKLWSVEPPKPIKRKKYWCDKEFKLGYLKQSLEERDKYGLLVMDRREANIGVLDGKTIEEIKKLTSEVPGKQRQGGQCVYSDALVQLKNGLITEIKNIKPGHKLLSCNSYDTSFAECSKVFSRKADKVFQITTSSPKTQIKATPEHLFFVVNGNGLDLKYAEDLLTGDKLLVTRKANVNGKNVKFKVKIPVKKTLNKKGASYIKKERKAQLLYQRELAKKAGLDHQAIISRIERCPSKVNLKTIRKVAKTLGIEEKLFSDKYIKTEKKVDYFPTHLTPKLAQLIGYIAGDGWRDGNRIRIAEERKELTEIYKKLAKNQFRANVTILRRNKKNYWILTIYGKGLTDHIEKLFPKAFKPSKSVEVPEKIMISKDKVAASFLKGVFDAEGYIGDSIGIRMSSKKFIRQIQLLLLRFGIISYISLSNSKPNYKVKTESKEWQLGISGKKSIEIFQNRIGFSLPSKQNKVGEIKRTFSRSNKPPIDGKYIKKIVKDIKLNTTDFETSTNFFRGEGNMCRETFGRVILERVRRRINELENAESKDIREFRNNLRLTVPEISKLAKIENYKIYKHEEGKKMDRELLERVRNFLRDTQKQMISKAREILNSLKQIYKSDLVVAEIVEKKEVNPEGDFYDLIIPKTKKFIANRILLHNSARRFDRLTEQSARLFYKDVAEAMDQIFGKGEELKGIVVGGPGPTKREFVDEKHLRSNLQEKVLGVLDVSYTGKSGLKELVNRSEDLLEKLEVTREKQIMQEFLEKLGSNSNLTAYKKKEVKKALDYGAVEKLLLSERLETDVIKKLSKKADQIGAEVELISLETEEGKQLWELGGSAAILRYPI